MNASITMEAKVVAFFTSIMTAPIKNPRPYSKEHPHVTQLEIPCIAITCVAVRGCKDVDLVSMFDQEMLFEDIGC
jgi:hypothetical protein